MVFKLYTYEGETIKCDKCDKEIGSGFGYSVKHNFDKDLIDRLSKFLKRELTEDERETDVVVLCEDCGHDLVMEFDGDMYGGIADKPICIWRGGNLTQP